jgi:hypothetical protein
MIESPLERKSSLKRNEDIFKELDVMFAAYVVGEGAL